MTSDSNNLEQIQSLCKRRGFIYSSGTIYGGLKGFYDYGPLGARLRKNIRDLWWREMVMATPVDPKNREPLTVVPFEGAIISNPQVSVGSGHRTDAMLRTEVGFFEGDRTPVYLRPDIRQNIFSNFQNLLSTNRLKLPFGVAQIGKSFRNELSPRHSIAKSREFEQLEMLWFFAQQNEASHWQTVWENARHAWWVDLDLDDEKLSFVRNDERGSSITYRFPWGVDNIEDLMLRGDEDLKRHAEASGWDLRYFDQTDEKLFYPQALEVCAGLDRAVFAVLCDAYTVDEQRPCKEFMQICPKIAPIKVAFFPLVNRDGLPELAHALYMHYRRKFDCVYDAKQSVGRRYARQDEIGTPFCVTIDRETVSSDTVTVRFRDSMEQQRIDLESLEMFLTYKLG